MLFISLICVITEALNTKNRRKLLKNHVVKRVQNVSDRPPLVSKKLFFFPGRISCVWRGDPVRSLWLFGAEAGFPPLAFPPEQSRKSPEQWRKPLAYVLGGIVKNSSTNGTIFLSQPIPQFWIALVFAGMHVSNKHNTVRSGCGASSSVRRWLPPFSPWYSSLLELGAK